MVPLVIFVGIVAVVAIIAYTIMQSGGSTDWAVVERDLEPDLPGEFVPLQEIYGGAYDVHGENPTGRHVNVDVDYAGDGNTNPPAGGPHWGSSACSRDGPGSSPPFCGPAPWGIYREPWEPETLVHNSEHGGVVVWYNTTDQEIIDELEDLVFSKLEDGDILVMAPYPDMEEEHIALTSWARIDKVPVGEYTKDRVEEYIDVHVRRFNPEQF